MSKWTFVIVLCVSDRVFADRAANGSNGINARVTGLDGSGGWRWTPFAGRGIRLNKVVGLAARRTAHRSCAAAAAV